jgi:hypothetical protein
VYGYACPLCDHPTSGHLLAEDGDLREGPYECSATGCTCQRPQEADDIPLTRRQWAQKFGVET